MSDKFGILKSYDDVEPYIEHARVGADKERNALGFLPLSAYRQAAEQGKLFVAVDAAGVFLGHIIFGGLFPHGKVLQIFCKPEFRNRGIAQALMNELVEYLQARSYLSLSAKVASDLSGANGFYERMGFHTVSTVPGGKSRNRLLYYRVRDLNTPSLFNLMAPKKHDRLPSLGLSGSYSTESPIYAVDLNVVFDVSKQRRRSEEAGIVMNAGFSNDIRLVITSEFITELKRTTKNFRHDPHLQLALQMQVLPTPKPQQIDDIERRMASVIFPERYRQGTLTTQDKSDLKHLATAIHHRIAGFITSEKALLRAHDYFQSEYGLDVLGVSDFADAMSSGDDDLVVDEVAVTSETEISSGPLSVGTEKEVRSFLKRHHVPPKTLGDALSRGDSVNSRKHMVLNSEAGIIAFASWTLTQNPRTLAKIFLCADETAPAAKTAVDHTLHIICSGLSAGAPARFRLHLLPSHPVTRKIALAHGFRPNPGQEEHGTTLHKVSIGDVVDEKSWVHIRRSLISLVGVELPATIPTFKNIDQRVLIRTPSGEDEEIPFQELETLLSPALILLPGRLGAVVSIKRVFADELLGTAKQFSLLTQPEAVLLKERVYYNTPRAAPILGPGTPILFYESSAGGGRKSIVAVGRVTGSRLLTGDQVNPDTKRRGVLSAESFKYIGAGDTKLVTTFDNIMAFRRPVSLDRLREIGCADGANFVTAKRISHYHLVTVIQEGLRDG